MKAFLTAVAVMVAVGVLAWLVLGLLDMSAQDQFARSTVRL